MKYFQFIFKSAIEDFSRNKMRTFLTSLGILIGVASVVLLIAFGLGLKKYIQQQFESLGTNLVIVFPGQVLKNGQFNSSPGSLGGGVQFDERDLISLQKIPEADAVVPAFVKSVTVEVASTAESGTLYATSQDIFPVRNLEEEFGRVFTKTDVEKRGKIVVIGPKIATNLFGTASGAVGKSVSIDKQRFTVIGVLKSKGGGGFGGPDFDSIVYIPYKSALVFNPNKTFITLYLKAKTDADIPIIKEKVTSILSRRYKKDDFSLAEQTEILNAVSSIFAVLNIVLVSIAAISLVVGGIGIMNIMYVSVMERIREIGIRRALGARKFDILSQFLMESVLLSLIGGAMGLRISFLLVLAIQPFFPAYINAQSILIAVGVSSAIGVIFGVFPARKAADLSPIDAIRYE